MKGSKIVTPVLLYLMILLLILAAYFNFAYRPLQSKIEALTLENELVKVQRMEIELAMLEKEKIQDDIDRMKVILGQDNSLRLTDGSGFADAISSIADETGIVLQDVTIGEPELEKGSGDIGCSLLKLPAAIRFINDFDRAAAFIGEFEASRTGAYRITGVDVMQEKSGQYLWQVSINLYYYGDPSVVKPKEEETAGRDIGEQTWTQ